MFAKCVLEIVFICSRAVYRPCVVTTSCLEVSAKRNLKSCICELGGHLVADWRKQCSLLVMSSLSVTIKVRQCQGSLQCKQIFLDTKGLGWPQHQGENIPLQSHFGDQAESQG
jgi:hypothetical protein